MSDTSEKETRVKPITTYMTVRSQHMHKLNETARKKVGKARCRNSIDYEVWLRPVGNFPSKPTLTNKAPSIAPVEPKLQHEPHTAWSLTGVTAPEMNNHSRRQRSTLIW